jgi:hypothetical protein
MRKRIYQEKMYFHAFFGERAVLGLDLRILYALDKHPTTEITCSLMLFPFDFFETESY